MSIDIGKYREWIADIQYPDCKPLRCGTLYIEPGDYTVDDIVGQFRKMIDRHLPAGYYMLRVTPGKMWAETKADSIYINQINGETDAEKKT